MPGATTLTQQAEMLAVAKKKQDADQKPGSRPINFRASAELARRLDFIADAMDLDVSNLVRMILKENLQPYERRAQQIVEAESEEPSA